MEQSVEYTESETVDDPENKEKMRDFCVNVSAIESVSRDQQASELQSLELEVFDHATLEKGIIAQVNEAIQSTGQTKDTTLGNEISKEDGEIDEDAEEEDEFARRLRLGEVTPFDQSEEGKSLQERSKNGFNEAMQRYMENQARLQKSRTKKNGEESFKKSQTPKVVAKRKTKAPKEFVPVAEEVKKEKKSKAKSEKKRKFLDKKKKKSKKEKLTRKTRDAAQKDSASEPGENAIVTLDHSSGSEYLPSDSEDSDDAKQEKSRKPLRALMAEVDTDYSESDWESSDDEAAKKRRSNKELDDGDPHYFTKRVKGINQQEYTKDLHVVLDEFRCPKIVWDKLYKYQQVAVKWFWELNQQRCGGILGDEMGLGKTIQVIAFLAGLYASDITDYDTGHSGLGPSLIVCPTTVMHQWVREFHKWFPIIRVAILHESGTFTNTGKDKSRLIDSIHSHDYGVLITSYSGLVMHSKKILDKQWHYVILDEGHKIRNHQAQVTVVAKQLETPHRLILSGSPLQNNLKELWSLFDFIYPGKLGTLPVFTNVFHLPIVAGGYTNANPAQVMQAFKCALTLKDTITPYLLRRMKRDVDAHIKLPPKTEQVLFCKLTEDQRQMYQHYLNTVSIEDMARGNAKVFVGLINLRKICNHPDLYSGGPNRNFTINDQDADSDENRFGYWERAGKMIVVRTLLKIWNQQNHRVLLFTQTQKMLLILEDFVKRCGYNYLKLDGNTSVAARQPLIDKFNKDTSYFVMLLTTKVGGLGVNLTGANRVVIYDPDWNPATDTQARERAWRIGQEKDVTVYRLVTAGTIEEKIYHRQIFKQFLSNKVLKDPKQRRFFKSNDLSELFTLSETVKDGTNETAAIFAGTGSEVKVSKLSMKSKKPKYSAQENAKDPKITFSESKIEQMKKRAQLLSKKILSKVAEEPKAGCSKVVDDETKTDDAADTAMSSVNSNEETVDKFGHGQDIYGPDGQIIPDNIKNLETSETCTTECETPVKSEKCQEAQDANPVSKMKIDENDNHSQNSCRKRSVSSSSNEPSPRKKKHKESKRGTFEGHHVPHLVKCRKVKKDRDSDEKEAVAVSQDDYVLRKLFSKSGIETALRHDTIMEGGPHDYAIIEAEADRVAQEAIKALKESRAEVPVVRKPLFKPSKQGSTLLSAIKKRNMVVDASDAENELVRSLVTFLNSKGGVASTDKIIEHFSEKVGPGKSPLFKSLLGKIAKFHRGTDKVGYWTVQDEFKI